MHAIVIPVGGGLNWAEVADPEPGAGEVLIDVVAAGVNRADLMQAAGKYPPPPGAPPYPGLECAGRIVSGGPGERSERIQQSWKPGDEVCALLAGGKGEGESKT